MSLNCLTSQVLQRTDSDNYRRCGKEHDSSIFCCIMIDRSLSMNISPGGFERNRSNDQPISVVPSKNMKGGAGHRRRKTIATTYGAVGFEADVDGEPKLVRSSGMRRDWSFEDLMAQRDEKMMRKDMSVG